MRTSKALGSPALDNAKTDTLQIVKRVEKDDTTCYVVNPSIRLRQAQNHILYYLKKRKTPSRYSGYGESNSYYRIMELYGFFDILQLDLKNTFEQITYSRIVGLLRNNGLPLPEQFATCCVYNSRLMRGSICSNYILELILKRLDYRIAGIVHRHNLFYKRYIDDLFIYGFFDGISVTKLLFYVNKTIQAEGFCLNENKTRISYHEIE